MVELPSGTVTFLFTDIEGSTARWEHQPEAMRVALARHDALVRVAIREHGGHIVKTMGDAFHAAFSRASDALAAAIDAQRSLQAESWGEISPLRVRMALHTGAAEERDGDYYGPPLNRAARLLGTAHGGQLLLSQTTYDLIQDAAPEGTTLVDLGEHRLKDLNRPERVFQLVASDLPSEFPSLRSLDARPHNLPVQATPLLGRDREVEGARARLLRNDVRLLTLTGPGGTGKTRLSLQVAADLVDYFPDGVFFVALAPISALELVPVAIAQALQLRDVGGRPLLDSLKEYLRNRTLLLVLDNFEQILSAAVVVAELLSASQGLKVLITSRAALALRGEHELHVPPLALPDLMRPATLDDLSQYAAVALFAERAAAIKSDFALTEGNAPAVAEICVRLDGLPLAIELAAARTRLLSPQAMITRLDRRLPLLSGGARDLPERQRTLRDTIAWSYELLTEPEQRLFRRLSIFVGGCTLEAAEVGCAGEDVLETDILDGLASLVAKSLVREDDGPDGEPRFGMLETIREFGLEQLEASGEMGATRQAHAEFFLAFAEEAEPKLFGPEQIARLRRLEAEHENLRTVLARSRTGEIAGDVALRVAASLYWFWALRGFVGEGRGWMEAMLALPAAEARTVTRARLLHGAATLAIFQADYVAALDLVQESVAIFRETGELRGAVAALVRQGLATYWGAGDPQAARTLQEENVSLARTVGDQWGLAFALSQLAGAFWRQGNASEARPLLEEAVAIARDIGDRYVLGLGLISLAWASREGGDETRAAEFFRESLVVGSEFENHWLVLRALTGMASAAALAGRYENTARFIGFMDAVRDAIGMRDFPDARSVVERDMAAARAALGEEAFTAVWTEGRAMSLAEAVAYALEAPVLT